ncbi:hypothetical protein ACFX15_036317 [Malus domestica]
MMEYIIQIRRQFNNVFFLAKLSTRSAKLKSLVERRAAGGLTDGNAGGTYPYRARRTNGALVKLALELPAVNLPPAVGVVSQSASRGCLRGTSTSSTQSIFSTS